jgi:uncharacterized membrane protein YeaQ/YmgE (transglycosylase-associated protein family)
MIDVAQQVFVYFQENILATIVISLIAGFAASKSVTIGKQGGLIIFLILGFFGTFLGQFAILYSGVKTVLDHVPEFRYFFDLFAAYIGSFILSSLVRLVRPL